MDADVVKVSLDRRYIYVVSECGLHLSLLHLANAVYGIEYGNLNSVNVTVALESRLSRVSARRDKDVYRFVFSRHFQRA